MSLQGNLSELPDYLTDRKEEQDQLIADMKMVMAPWTGEGASTQLLNEAYTRLGLWYAKAKDSKRRSSGANRLDYQFAEDLLEALVKGADRSVMVSMHLARLGG